MLPTNKRLRVKKTRHHNKFRKAFTIIKIVVVFDIPLFLIQKKFIPAKSP